MFIYMNHAVFYDMYIYISIAFELIILFVSNNIVYCSCAGNVECSKCIPGHFTASEGDSLNAYAPALNTLFYD
jgi:hypothetical protein